METLIIQVDCRPYTRDGPPQLGITVEAPFSQRNALQQKRQQLHQTAAKDYHDHDYQNLDADTFRLRSSNGGGGGAGGGGAGKSATRQQNKNYHQDHTKQHITSVFNASQPAHEGLQITKIQQGSVIDRIGQFRVGDIIVEVNGVNLQRPFAEAQRTLKQFVVEHTSHGPLVLKVLRKSASSSSIPSTTGSQITVIERDIINNHKQQPTMPQAAVVPAPSMSVSSKRATQQQVAPSISESPTSPKSTSSSSKTSRHLVGSLNTRKIGVKHTIRLRRAVSGFGIKIAERDNMHGTKNRPIYITAITTTGSAYQDGRLKEGDMLLEVNGIDLHGKSQPEVTKMLKAVKAEEEVEFVISRQENFPSNDSQGIHENSVSAINDLSTENDCDKSLIDLDVPDQDDSVFVQSISNQQFEKKIDSILNVPIIDGPGTYIYDIPINDTKSAGLGLYLKYPCRADDRKDLGIWIEKVITGGAAWKDGRLQPNDQIYAINGIDLVGLSNAEASETLTAAVCRGIGPEATPNTIRLRIHRRSPSVVAKILQGTNNRIEYSDIIPTGLEKSYNNTDNSRDSYQTALDNTLQNKTTDNGNSSGSSNQYSQNDSAMSPQTQASNSLKLTSSCLERSDQSSSDKTNETTSSAISQITDSMNNVPSNDFLNMDKDFKQNSDSHTATQPKSIHTGDESMDAQNVDRVSSSQSWDDESTDATPGEDRFQRDGFGRQSISEKRHAQLNAKNTDTFKRNQQRREEQRQLEEQMARQRLDDDRMSSYYPPMNNHKLPTSYTTNEFKSIYSLKMGQDNFGQEQQSVDGYYREVPVNVHMPFEPKIANDRIYLHQESPNTYSDDRAKNFNGKVPNPNNQMIDNQTNHMLHMNQCTKCGSTTSPCLCETNLHSLQMRNQVFDLNQGYDHMFKRSNSLESVQQHLVRDGLIIPRAGTVRVARNRKVNESFRAAVDRSYEGSTNESSSRQDHSDISEHHRGMNLGAKITSSVANSTASTSNEERYLITNKNGSQTGNHDNNENNNITHKKSSSLLTKFLKFGSMKKKKKNKNAQDDVKPVEMKSSSRKDTSNRDASDNTRSQSSKGTHFRTQSSQSHPNLNGYQCNNHSKPATKNGQMYNHNLKQAAVLATNHIQNGADIHTNRASMPVCQYQPVHNPHTHYQVHLNHLPMTQAKYSQNMTTVRAPANNHPGNLQQYSHAPMHQHSATALYPPPSHHMQAVPPQVGSIHLDHHSSLYSSGRSTHMVNPSQAQLANRLQPNGCPPPQPQSVHWQTSHFQAPNGLWVTSSPATENQLHPKNVYGTLQHHQQQNQQQQQQQQQQQHHHHHHNMINMQQPHAQHQQPSSLPPPLNGGPFNSTMSSNATNGVMQQPPAAIHSHPNHQHHQAPPFGAAASHAQNHQQPQHIYYYDF